MIVGCFLFTYFAVLNYRLSAARRLGPRKPNSHVSQVKCRSGDAIFTKEIEVFRCLGFPE